MTIELTWFDQLVYFLGLWTLLSIGTAIVWSILMTLVKKYDKEEARKVNDVEKYR